MKFFELKVGDKFNLNNDEQLYVKVKEEKLTCCKIKLNAKKVGSPNEDIIIKPLQDVVKVEETSAEQ